MAKSQDKRCEAGPIGLERVTEKEFEIYQVDLAEKYSIPFFGSSVELAEHLEKLSRWLRAERREP